LPDTRILAFDTSAAHCAAALLIGDRIVAQSYREMGKGQAECLMPMLQNVMDGYGAVWEELDAIGVGTGPGNFTGIRISVSAARGLALALGIPAVGVSTFEVVRRVLDAQQGLSVTLLPGRGENVLGQVSRDGAVSASWQAARADFICHTYLDEPAVIRVSDPLPDFEVYHVQGVGIDCDAPAFEIGNLGTLIAPAIAEIAAVRLSQADGIARPTPLYIRPADAAPPREAPPVILP